nr:cullin-9 [Zonotrichia albicollis]
MEADVRSLVRRAGRQVAEAGSPECSVLSTVHVLGAYASIGSLAGAFREAGALELLTAMLCHRERRIRRGAGEMLRVLGAHDAGIWAHVLLSLSQQDGIEQHMDFDSRCTLLELFAEITSSAEPCLSFEGIHLPQIPGKQLFVLVKRYLCVTSLLDKLSSSVEQGEEQQGCAVPSPVPEHRSRVKQEFELSMAMANLISELVHAMGWSHRHRRDPQPRPARSIFQHKPPASSAAQKPVLPSNPAPHEKQGCAFLSASDFADSSDYTEYLRAHLVRGMRVRLLEDCGDIRAGEEGEFLQSTNNMHTVQVLRQSTGRTYWVRWHILEIVGFGDQWEDPAAQEKESSVRKSFSLDTVPQAFLCKPLGGLYSLPYLGQRLPKAADTLSRAEWWELLFFVRKLGAQEQEEITCLIQQHLGEQVGIRACSREMGGRSKGNIGEGSRPRGEGRCELCRASLGGAEMGGPATVALSWGICSSPATVALSWGSVPALPQWLCPGASRTWLAGLGQGGGMAGQPHGVFVCRELSMLVASEDSSYMPSRVVVLGGDSPATIRTELNAVTILPSDSRVILLENMTRFWPVIQIRVKRCQQGGIDTRVRGIEVLGPKPTFWPIFREQLCRRTFLSCTARAHAWSQEICRDRGRLLQLFGRLNRALQHEQGFANCFLPDEEAARALGRTFWEALVTPLVQSITSPGPDGVSALAWLLSEYLESAELPRRAPGRRAAFGSCVRRLTQLLVHVDPGGPEPEETRAAGGKERKNKKVSARTAKVVVEKSRGLWGISQCWRGVVQQQVQRFLEAAGQAPDLAERYCRLYQRLRGATEELFGQQAAFVLALGQGFAGALLQLSFLTALHVSEQFARYLDVQIQELRRAVGSTGPLERLEQFLEPFVVFSGLEFAHTFEHFYRHYLGDRLLTQGPSWLEGGIVEQIGLCFPSRFPQDMLSNLAESEELQRQFSLFQLQEQDKRLLELDTGLDEVLGTATGAEVPEVKVLALSPRCWPVSPLCYMESPGRFFPALLSSPLDEFADFCRQSQSQLGWECSKPRRLQWTWLGHAELQFGECVLHVSTLQMYILLCFNSAQEVAVEALLGATGLPADLVLHAVTPLTQGQAVLVGSCTPGGALRLNQAALAQSCGRRLRLLPQQRYLRTEGAEVSALERKRNVLCCLITRILKGEKQLHIDSLVFRVIDACQKGELGPGVQFLSFCCHSVDVLSCILHLLNQGYLRRQEGRPHILEYISAESTTPLGGQAQMTFRCRPAQESVEKDGRDSLHWRDPGTDRAEEYLMAMLQVPMGHTLSPEEAKLLMNQTVQQVQDTLSIPDDVARHLLMHCRWNVDFLIQCYVENREGLLISSGLQVQDVQPPPSPGTHCPVCVNQLCPTEKPPTLCCMHYCCKPCWREYLTTRIEQNMVVNCTCPISECRAQPTTAFIYSIVSSEEIIAKYEKALLRRYVECCSNLTWCTNPQGCDQILLKDGLGYGAACSKCSWISCFNCSFPEAHYPASCSHMSRWVDDDGYYEGMTSEAQSKHLAKLISKHCPNCQAQIEKNEGCLHMTCAKCNHGFCWRCLKPWRPNHKDYYNCSAMVSKAAWQEKRFQDYNERCTFHHHAREFAVSLRNSISSIREMPKIRNLTFVLDACKVLEQARKVLAYSCVYSYYNQDTESMDIVEQQTESLELLTNALQILLEETLLQYQDLATSLQLLKAEHFHTGLELVRQIRERLFAILWHSTQDFHVGLQTSGDAVQRKLKLANVPASALACTGQKRILLCDSPNTDEGGKDVEDEDYDPQWQEDYDDDDDDLDEDNFMIDNDSDCDSYFDDNDSYRS